MLPPWWAQHQKQSTTGLFGPKQWTSLALPSNGFQFLESYVPPNGKKCDQQLWETKVNQGKIGVKLAKIAPGVGCHHRSAMLIACAMHHAEYWQNKKYKSVHASTNQYEWAAYTVVCRAHTWGRGIRACTACLPHGCAKPHNMASDTSSGRLCNYDAYCTTVARYILTPPH